MNILMQVLIQMNIIIVVVVVVILITKIITNFTTVRRWTVGVAKVMVDWTFVVSKAVRKIQSVCVALIK